VEFGKARALEGAFSTSKKHKGDQRDYPEEISDQHPEHHQEGNRGQRTGSATSFGKRRPFQRSQLIA
jgi:hypothetical protein